MAGVPKTTGDMLEALGKRAKAMENRFFYEADQKLIENHKKLKLMKEGLASLQKVSGIQDERILGKLIELRVRPETLASLAVIPLVEIAWADGSLDRRERQALLSAAAAIGMNKQGIDYQLLESWMTIPPELILFETWEFYVRALSSQLNEEERTRLRDEVLRHAREIAEASGGILGLGVGSRVSRKETSVLARLEEAFG
jgi:hypothetical protein